VTAQTEADGSLSGMVSWVIVEAEPFRLLQRQTRQRRRPCTK